METRILNLVVVLLLVISIGAKAQTEPEIIWHTPNVEASSLILSPDEQFVYANRTDVQLGNVFTQLRVDDGTIVRKDVSTIGHIGGFSVDGRYVFAINLRISNKIYKANAETFEKVDSLVFPSNILADGYFTSYAMSYDRKYLYLGAFGNNEPKVYDNFFVVDTETMEIVHSASYIYQVPTTLHLYAGEIYGIYPSPNNEFIALHVGAGGGVEPKLLILNQIENYNTIYSYLQLIVKGIMFNLNGELMVVNHGGNRLLLYNTSNFKLIDSLIYNYNPDGSGGIGSIITSEIDVNIFYIGSMDLHKLNIQELNEICWIKSKINENFIFRPRTTILSEEEKNLISTDFNSNILKFKNCTTSTGVNNNKEETKILQVIDNKLTISINIKQSVSLNYQISDIRGVMVTQKSMVSPSNELIIDVHHLVPGTYFLTLQIGKEIVNYKFIILR